MTNKFFFHTREQNITAVGGSTAELPVEHAGDVLSVCDAGQVVIAQAASAGTSTTTPWITVAGLTQSVSQ